LIDLSSYVRADVIDILRRHLGSQPVYLVGSRARGPAKRFADIDLLLMNDHPLSPTERALLRNDFEESDIPYKVDLLEWTELSPGFRERLRQEAELLG
jgi:predicted nucleotidyltransferase